MSAPGSAAGSPHYDRDFLLSPTKRNEMMELWEVEKFGTDSFGDPDYVSIYGMRPAEWYARGELLARTTLEAVRDRLGAAIGEDVARWVTCAPKNADFAVLDPFAGSCNGLYWVLRHVPQCQSSWLRTGFRTVFKLTSDNLSLLDFPIELIQGDYREQIGKNRFSITSWHFWVHLGGWAGPSTWVRPQSDSSTDQPRTLDAEPSRARLLARIR